MLELKFARQRKGPFRILCLGAHSDDIEIGCGGLILSLIHSLDNVEVDWVVFSGTGQREREARSSARMFLKGAGRKRVRIHRFKDGFFPYDSRVKTVFESLERLAPPDLVLTHYRDDRHQDHRVLSDLAWNTFRNHVILEYEIPKWDGDLGSPNCFFNLDGEIRDKKVEYLEKAFGSQRSKDWFTTETFMGLMRLRGMECRAPSGYAEAFYSERSESRFSRYPMPVRRNLQVLTVSLRAPVIVMVLAATAIPVEWRSAGQVALGFEFQWSDFVANVAGYLPVGLVLGDLGLVRAVILASLMSLFAESGQLLMLHRAPSVIDVASNVLGAFLGAAICRKWSLSAREITVGRWKALLAVATACGISAVIWMQSGDIPNSRGVTSPGILEGYWRLDEGSGATALDSSGHGLNGRISGSTGRVAGKSGTAARLDGAGDFVDLGHSTAFRLTASMTIAAWINSSSNPVDDAAIVSNHSGSFLDWGAGYQLDTTVDKGPRTIGFKLFDACGRFVARYGHTPLLLNTWYHVVGVFDAQAQTLDVYLNGNLDNGALVGSVPTSQRSSRTRTFVGRRGDSPKFDFAGSIDEVSIYSRALTSAEIMRVMEGTGPQLTSDHSPVAASHVTIEHQTGSGDGCLSSPDRDDARLPAAVVLVGMLVALGTAALWPTGGRLLAIAVSLSAGLALLLVVAPTLPSLDFWLTPLTSLMGGTTVALSLRRSPS